MAQGIKHRISMSIRNPVVGAHQFDGRNLLPGLAYIDLLFQTFARFGLDVHGLELRELAIHRPLIVAPDHDIALSIEAAARSDDEWRVQVLGRRRSDGAGTEERARRYAVATMLRAPPPLYEEVLDWNAVQSAATATLQLADIYDASARHGLVHGPYMRADGCVYVTPDAIYVDCQLGAEARAHAADLRFHPALIDASVVGATAALSTLAGAQKFRSALPLSYDTFRSAQPLPPALMARVRRDSVRAHNELTSLSMDFFDLSGRKIAELGNFASKTLRGAAVEFGAEASDADDEDAAQIAAPVAVAVLSTAQDELTEFLRQLIAGRIKRPLHEVRADASFYEMGINSTGLLELAHAIEGRVGRKQPPTLLFQYSNIDEVVQHLAGQSVAAPAAHTPSAVVREPAAAVAVRARRSGPSVARARKRRVKRRDIAVIGLSGRYPQAETVQDFWEKLREGADCVTEIPAQRWDGSRDFDGRKGEAGKSYSKWGGFIAGVEEFDALFFGMSPREAQFTDPQQRLFLETVWNLLESAGYTREGLKRRHGGKVGVYVGSMYSEYDGLRAEQGSAEVLQSFQSGIANRVSHYFGLTGPSVAVDTMCSSSLAALHWASTDLKRGECELAIAGGVNLTLDARKYVVLSQAQLLSSRFEGRSFGDSDGYLPAEAVAAVLLKPLRDAERDGDEIWAIVKGTATNHGGSGQAYSVPNAQGQVQVMQEALRRAGVAAASISYVEAAASGSGLSDAIEVAALGQVLGEGAACALGAVKSNIGHAEAASGITQLSKVLLQMRHGLLVPTIRSEPANPNLRLEGTRLTLQRVLGEWLRPVLEESGERREQPRRALINSFGAGGSNASAVLEEYRAPAHERSRVQTSEAQVAVFSARTATGLTAVVERMLAWLQQEETWLLSDLAYTLQECREAMEHRLALVVRERAELMAGLRAFLTGDAAGVHYTGDLQSAAQLKQVASGGLAQGMAELALAQRDLARVAQFWTQHVAVDWSALRADETPRRLALPTYPFAKRRHWLALDAAEAERGAMKQEDSVSHAIADTGAFVLAFLQRALRVSAEELDAHRPLREFGVDSVVGLSLVRALNDRFGVALGGRALIDHPTIDALTKQLSTLQSQHADSAPMPRAAVVRTTPSALRSALRDFKSGVLTRGQVKELLGRSPVA